LARSAPSTTSVHATARDTSIGGTVSRRLDGVHHLDLTVARRVAALMEEVGPDLVFHTAYSPARADTVDAASVVAQACADAAVPLVHLSSDTVFGGRDEPYTEVDAPDPMSEYGTWKVEAEQAVAEAAPDAAIMRFSLVVSTDPPDGVTAQLLAAARDQRPIGLFTDEVRTPIAIDQLVARLWTVASLAAEDRRGLRHVPGPEFLTRYELGVRLAQRIGIDPSVITASRAADHPAPRPRVLRLATTRPLLDA